MAILIKLSWSDWLYFDVHSYSLQYMSILKDWAVTCDVFACSSLIYVRVYVLTLCLRVRYV